MPDLTPFPLPARPTTYKGIKMRSRLEAEAAAMFDTWADMTWQYEPMCFASSRGQYLPDFLLVYRGSHTYFEIKPIVHGVQALKDRMEIIWESEPRAILSIMEMRGSERTWTAIPGDRKWRRDS